MDEQERGVDISLLRRTISEVGPFPSWSVFFVGLYWSFGSLFDTENHFYDDGLHIEDYLVGSQIEIECRRRNPESVTEPFYEPAQPMDMRYRFSV